VTADTWRENWPRGVVDPLDPDGTPIVTPTDRRLLWHIEGVLAVAATNDRLRRLGSNIRQYLNETCEHHWKTYEGDEVIDAHRQCLWCHAVEWHEDGAVSS
jgi:hypothetical protein